MNARYQVVFDRRAEKSLKSLPESEQQRIEKAIDGLAINPRPNGAIKMTGVPSWRLRVGDYRVIYDVHDKVLTVLVLKIGHRREIYR